MKRASWHWPVILWMIVNLAWGQTYEHDRHMAEALQNGPPAQGVVDDFDVLRNDPALRAELENEIQQLEKDYGYRIRLLMRPVWMGGTVQELAATLQEVWFPNGDGLVMIVETDNRKLGLGMPFEGRPDEKTWLIPTHVASVMLKTVSDRAKYDAPMREFLSGLVFDMVAQHRNYFDKRSEPLSAARVKRESLFWIGLAALLALAALVTTIWMRIARKREGLKVMGFPPVSVAERLEAPYGGGRIAIVKFGEPDA